MGFLWSLIIGGIGWLAGISSLDDVPFGIISNIIAGFVGAWLGSLFWNQTISSRFRYYSALIGATCLFSS
jgi:uncharacterized membrane protein YeaQ/YmgE (transglycosylase-associated protein family)